MLGAPPWAIATVARESILGGNEFRRADVTAEALRVIFNAHNDIEEGITSASVGDFLVRTAYQQFPYQESMFEEVARSHALLVEGASESDTEVLNPDAWEEVLGAPLGQVVGATFFLQVVANANAGRLDPLWLEIPGLEPIFQAWPRDVIEQRAEALSSTFPEFRTAYDTVPHPPRGFERYAYNPLVRRPFVRMPDGVLLAPQPRLILRTASPGSLYYAGVGTFGQSFTRDLGLLTQHYVGKQLKSTDRAITVHPEILYRVGKNELRSIDWFVDLPGLLVLVEVKSVRFGLLERSAFGDYRQKVKALLDEAVGQLERSSQAIDSGQPEFSHLDRTKPRIGIVVTGEPYYLGNSSFFRELLTATPSFPTLTASLRDIEHLVQLELADFERQLSTIANDPERSTWNLGSALPRDLPARGNVILRRAWESYPWPSDPVNGP